MEDVGARSGPGDDPAGGQGGAGPQAGNDRYPHPPKRLLRVFAFDPQASAELDTALVNDAVIELPWESGFEDALAPGPVNQYLEIVDFDPSSGCFYAPVDLDHPHLLAQDGLAPSDGNPQFHQQMLFAVIMDTIRTFERALGRVVLWAREPEQAGDAAGGGAGAAAREYVRRLRVYPHALREANAYYSPAKAALLFGYFQGRPARDGTGGGWVFTCLSQDIVAHEAVHAILHGMWPRLIEASNADSIAFHEAFADLVALFRHFGSHDIVAHQLARAGGSLRSASLLNGLARQFGRATGRDGPLRFALRMLEEEEEALARGESLAPDRNAGIREPHARGQILVAAVFDAFVTIYERRSADLFHLAGCRRGDMPLPPLLVSRLAAEAGKAARQVLGMCIRGLDYLPPVDVTFGEYLRAILTADADLIPDDDLRYRVAFAESFHKRGITVPGQRFSSPDSLLWDAPEPFTSPETDGRTRRRKDWKESADLSFAEVLRRLQLTVTFAAPPRADDIRPLAGASAYLEAGESPAKARNLRDLSLFVVQYNQRQMYDWLTGNLANGREWEQQLGVALAARTAPASIWRAGDRPDAPEVEVANVRISRRDGPDGNTLSQLIVQVLQRRRGYFSAAMQQRADRGELDPDSREWRQPDFVFRGGATIFVDLDSGIVRRVIRKSVLNDARLGQQRRFLLGEPENLAFRGGGA